MLATFHQVRRLPGHADAGPSMPERFGIRWSLNLLPGSFTCIVFPHAWHLWMIGTVTPQISLPARAARRSLGSPRAGR